MPIENQSMLLSELPGTVPQNAEASFDIPQAAAEFRTVPNDAEAFGKVPQIAERKETHALTVRESARMFEAAGVARTERSIINWCQPNRQGITRLDSYYDPNERKYYVTSQSVEAVIQEEIQRANKSSKAPASEPFGSHGEPVKHLPTNATARAADERKLQELERENLDLKIANRGKDYLIEQIQKERAGFFEKLLSANRTVGQLERNCTSWMSLNCNATRRAASPPPSKAASAELETAMHQVMRGEIYLSRVRDTHELTPPA